MRFVNAWHIEIVLTAAEKKVSQMFFFFFVTIYSLSFSSKVCFYLFVNIIFLHSLFVHTHNQFQNILRLYNVLPNFPFTGSETMCNYYL